MTFIGYCKMSMAIPKIVGFILGRLLALQVLFSSCRAVLFGKRRIPDYLSE